MVPFALDLLKITPEPANAVVVATGISLVFLILVLLTLIITVQGKIFDGIKAKQSAKAQQAAAAQAASAAAAPAPAAPAAPVAQVAPVAPVAAAPAASAVEAGIPGDVVAAITAAVECFGQGQYTVRSVARAERPVQGRQAWGRAGIVSYTEPF